MKTSPRYPRSEPHRVSEPVQLVLRDERSIVHNGWQNLNGVMRMGCSYHTREWTDATGQALTCVWCLSGYTPWLLWGSAAGARSDL